MKSIVEQVIDYSKTQPKKVAVTDGNESISYLELAESIFYAKKILTEKYGVRKGHYVVIAASKQLEFVSIYFACHVIGAIVVPIAPDTNITRFQYIKKILNPHLIIESPYGDSTLNQAPLCEFSGFASLENFSISIEQIADVMFTTGTTGEPKGVLLSQKNIASQARNINSFIQNSSSDIEMIVLPISHSFGIGRLRCALSRGQSVVLLGSFFNVKRFYKYMEEYSISGLGMVPSGWLFLKKYSGMRLTEYKDQLNYIEIGSSPMHLDEKKLLLTSFPKTRICMHYGLTEASRSTFIEFHENEDKLATIGKASPNVSISIRDDFGKEVPEGTEGEICVCGDVVFNGYINANRELSFWGDYFRTGDWGLISNDGFISLLSRKKELINIGGKKVSPIEVENVLMQFEFVDDCACIAIPDPNGVLGEVIKAFIVTKNAENVNWDYLDPLIGTKLEVYKHPVIYQQIDSIPKTVSGKVQRLLLRNKDL